MSRGRTLALAELWGLPAAVEIANLKRSKAYRIAVTCLDASANSLNKADGSGTAVFTTADDNFVAVTVSVNLADAVFSGTAHPVVSVSTGSVVDTTDAPAGAIADNL